MKYLVVIGDGMADYPLKELGDKTPLEVAEIPNMDYIASNGLTGLLKTVPDNMGPGSDVANLSIMGYDPQRYYTGRGPLEAASMGADLKQGEVAFRCNFIYQENGVISDFNADHISTVEASELIESLNRSFDEYGKFYLGTSYRNLFIFPDGETANLESKPPHDVVGESIAKNLLKPVNKFSILLNQIMEDSFEILSSHPINQRRIQQGKKPANMIWLWGQGLKPQMPSFKEKYGLNGATIAGVDLIKGIGVYLGLNNVYVPGATGFYDTDYCGKAKYALEALEKHDLVFVHVEAPDEAGHAGDLEEKIKAIERIDSKILKKFLDNLPEMGTYAISILPDHPTPLRVKTHTRDAVPYAMLSNKGDKDEVRSYDEYSIRKCSTDILDGHRFIKNFLDYAGRF